MVFHISKICYSVSVHFLSKRLKHNLNITVECQCQYHVNLSQTEADSGHPYIVTSLALVARHLFDEGILLDGVSKYR